MMILRNCLRWLQNQLFEKMRMQVGKRSPNGSKAVEILLLKLLGKKRTEAEVDAVKENERWAKFPLIFTELARLYFSRKFASCLLMYFVTTRQKMLDMTKVGTMHPMHHTNHPYLQVLCGGQGQDNLGCKLAKQETARLSKLVRCLGWSYLVYMRALKHDLTDHHHPPSASHLGHWIA